MIEINKQYKSKYKFLSEIYNICCKSYQGHLKPQKLILLLSILDLFDTGLITENKIFLNKDVTNSYTKYLNFVKKSDDTDRPWYPYFHLRSSYFWNHEIRKGFESDYQFLSSEQGISKINSIISYSYLSDDVFDLFLYRKNRIEFVNIFTQILLENTEDKL